MGTTGFNYITSQSGGFAYGGYWVGGVGATDRYFQYGLTAGLGSEQYDGYGAASSGNLNSSISGLSADTTYYMRTATADDAGIWYGSITSGKTYAGAATLPTPSSSSVTSTTATIDTGTFTPNVSSSTWTIYLYYKRTSDPSYTLAGSSTSSNPFSVNLTSLASSTEYSFYSELIRTTANDTTYTSSVQTFTTLAGEPTVTTDAASSIGSSSATLNCTGDVNEGTNMTVYWKWGTDNPPTQNTTATQAITADGSKSVGITGLSASTLYYVQAFITFDTPTGSPNEGSVVNFTTAADPAAEAAEEDHMLVFDYDAVYGVQKAFVFSAPVAAATSSNVLYTGAACWSATAAEALILIDGALSTVVNADGRATNAPTQISGPYYTITLTAAELAGENIHVCLRDSGAAVRDVLIRIRTKLQLGQITVNAGQLTNSNAMTLTGVGSGHGLSAVGGATGLDIDGFLGQHVQRANTAQAGGASTITLDASASATNDYYNGSLVTIVGGTGAGQSRVISDYVGATKVATVAKAWATNPSSDSVFFISAGDDVWESSPGAELSALPTYASSYGKLLQFLFQRFVYKRTQTATVFTMYKDDGSTSFASGGVSDNGTTQQHNELS